MFYVLRPQSPYTLVRDHPVYVDPEDAYLETKRREYVAALQQQQQRLDYERAVEAEEERHRARLAALAQQERMRCHATHRQSLPPHALRCAGPPYAPTNIVRGRYHRQHESPHFHTPASAPVPQPSRTQSEEITLDRLIAELFGHPAHHVRILPASDLSVPILTDVQEPEVTVRQPTAVPQQEPHTNSTSAPVASTSAALASAAASAPAEQSEGHWSDAVKRTRSVAVVAISKISRTFDSLKRAFTFPAGPLAPVPGSEAPRLAYNPTNAPIHAYEHALSELLTSLDAVESFGFRRVRELRKEVVVRIEKELEALERRVAEAIAAGASPVIKTTNVIPEEPATGNQADKVAEDTVMEEAGVAAVVASDHAEEITEGHDLVTDDTVTIVPAPAPTPAPTPVEPTLVADSLMVAAGSQTVTIEIAQPEADAFAFVLTPAEPKEDTIEAQLQAVDVDPITTEPAVEPKPESASQITESSADAAVVATPAPEPLSQTVLEDVTSSSSTSESEIEDAVDVTVSSDSDVEVSPEADDAASDAGAEKDYEML